MNTVKIGDTFEEKSYNLIVNAIKSEELGISEKFARVFRKQPYYSKDREKNIIFDLAIEIWPPNAERFSVLYVIECKSYSSKKVPVDDVEEFYSKIIQVAGVNVKGVFITDNSFQEGGLTFAKNKGMMLIEVKQDDSYSIVLHKTDKNDSKDRIVIGETFDFDKFIKQVFSSKKVEGLKFLSKESIENIANQILYDFDNLIFQEYKYTDLRKLVIFFQKMHALKFEFQQNIETSDGKKLFGYYNSEEKKVYIDNSLIGTERFAFVLAHEIGHFVLHSELKMNQEVYNNFQDSEYDFFEDKYVLKNDMNWIEWQANKFAVSILLPDRTFKMVLSAFQKMIGINKIGHIYYDDQHQNYLDYKQLIQNISEYFKTSKTSIIYRIEDLGLITYAKPKNLYQHTLRNLLS